VQQIQLAPLPQVHHEQPIPLQPIPLQPNPLQPLQPNPLQSISVVIEPSRPSLTNLHNLGNLSNAPALPVQNTQPKCAVCLDAFPTIMFDKCRHVCLCHGCSVRYDKTACPICTQKSSRGRVYM
jgi:hypothetical protein